MEFRLILQFSLSFSAMLGDSVLMFSAPSLISSSLIAVDRLVSGLLGSPKLPVNCLLLTGVVLGVYLTFGVVKLLTTSVAYKF